MSRYVGACQLREAFRVLKQGFWIPKTSQTSLREPLIAWVRIKWVTRAGRPPVISGRGLEEQEVQRPQEGAELHLSVRAQGPGAT